MSQPPSKMKAALFAVGLAAALYAAWSAWDREAMLEWLAEAGPLPFFALMAMLPAFGMPLTPFFILAGATFGRRLGLLGGGVALGLNLTLCYWAARKLRRPLESFLRRFSYELPDFSERQRQGLVRFTLAVKLAPGVPAFIKQGPPLGARAVIFPPISGTPWPPILTTPTYPGTNTGHGTTGLSSTRKALRRGGDEAGPAVAPGAVRLSVARQGL